MGKDSLSSEINVAAAHLAGPYNLSGSFKLTDAIAGYQFFVPFLVTAWQKISSVHQKKAPIRALFFAS